jgi:N-acetyl-anhydromuramyl-L-alanine amidase AmpD
MIKHLHLCHPSGSDWPWIKAYWADAAGKFKDMSRVNTLVIHSGAIGAGVAEYLATCRNRKVSAHFSFSRSFNGFVQQVGIDNKAWHVGYPWNDISIGVEFPGPWDKNPRSKRELEQFSDLLADLCGVNEYGLRLRYWTKHSDIDSHKKDPGPGFDDRFVNLLEVCGMTHISRPVSGK